MPRGPMSDQPTPQRKIHRRRGLRLAAALAVGMLVLASCASDSPVATEVVNTDTAAATIDGDALPDFTMPDPALGLSVPTITGTTVTGQEVTVGGDDTARIYMFVAHWCPHCQEELPEITEWLETDPLPNDVEIVIVSTAVDADRDNYPPSEWIQSEAWPATAIADSPESTIAQSFGLQSFPYWVAADADGTVVQRAGGRLGVAQVETLISLATN